MVAQWVSQIQGTAAGTPPTQIVALLAPTVGSSPLVDSQTTAIADAFLELNEKREQADYDHAAIFTRPDTRGHIALARQAVAVIEQANSDEALRFFGLIAMQARIQRR
jgi:hypothetical protein